MRKKVLLGLVLVFVGALLVGCAGESPIYNSYDLELSYDESQNLLSGELELEFVNVEEVALDKLVFHVWPTAFEADSGQSVVSLAMYKRAYYDLESEDMYGEYNILGVESEGSALEHSMVGEHSHMLEVKLPEPVEPKEQTSLTITFEARLPKINHRYGVGERSINFGNFYPVLSVFEDGEWNYDSYHYNGDPFYSEISNYKATIKCNAGFQLASSGEQNVISYENGTKTVEVVAEKVRDFAFVLSKFEIAEDKVDDVTVKYYYYGDERPEDSLKTALDSVKTFNELFGKYPYSSLSVVEASFVHGGMEFPNLVLISDDTGSYETYTTAIIHEIDHQWWYGVVGNDQYSEGWLDEGLAEFSVALFYDENEGYENSHQNMTLTNKNNFNIFKTVYTSALGEVDTSFSRRLEEFGSEQEYVYTAYVKGYLFHDTLYEKLGKRKYLSCLKNYYSKNAFKTATPEALIRAFGERELITAWINDEVEII